MAGVESLTVFEVADDRGRFLEYLRVLYELGMRPSCEAWLEEAACHLMGLDGDIGGPPTYLDEAWTIRRRRLLVVMTWPQRGGGRALKFAFDRSSDRGGLVLSGVFGRTYRELWGDVRDNLKWLVMLAQQRGSWDVLAREWGLWSNVLWESARLGLVRTPDGRTIDCETVDGLLSDEWDRPYRAREGFVLAWWDIVAAVECAGYSYEPLEAEEPLRGQARMQDGRYVWDRAGLLNRIGTATLTRRASDELLKTATVEVAALRNPELDPLALHRRITANGRIEPPALGSKYRPLFDRLDALDLVGVHGVFTLSSDELADLTSSIEPEARRPLRGARGAIGLPNAALTTEQWWYGPWNPNDDKRTATDDEAFSVALGKKSHTRAWMAAGLRARPLLQKGTLVEVVFEPVVDRRYWWPWRASLRDGSYQNLILGEEVL